MAIAFRAVGTTSKVASGNMSPGLPAGHALNDILILLTNQADTVSCSVTGWTNITGLTASFGAGNLNHQEVWVKRDNGSESAPTVTHASGSVSNAIIAAFSGVDSGLSLTVGAGGIFRDAQKQTGTNAATFTAPALTGVVSGDMRIFLGQFSVGDTSGATTNNWGTVSGWTEDKDDCSSLAGANAASFGIDHLLATGSAASVTSAVGWVGSTTSTTPQFWAWQCSQLALSSDASGGGLPTGQSTLDSKVPRAAMYRGGMRQADVDSSEFWLFAGKDVQFTGAGAWKTYDYPNPVLKNDDINRRWHFSTYHLMLIARDQFFGVPGVGPDYDWPNPVLKHDDINQRTWLGWYNLMLIARDALPFRLSDWPNPTLQLPDLRLRTHLWNPLYQLLIVILQSPFALLDWPNPFRYRPKHQDLQGSYDLTLIAQDQLPFDQTEWPNPVRIGERPVWRGFVDWFKLTFGQDALPFRLSDWPNPVRRRPDFGGFISSALQLLSAVIVFPFSQLDWPNPIPRSYATSLRTWAESVKTLLVGRDVLPFRLNDWPNPVLKRPNLDIRGWIDRFRHWLPVPVANVPGRLAPADYAVGTLTAADLSAKVTIVEMALGRTTTTDASAGRQYGLQLFDPAFFDPALFDTVSGPFASGASTIVVGDLPSGRVAVTDRVLI